MLHFVGRFESYFADSMFHLTFSPSDSIRRKSFHRPVSDTFVHQANADFALPLSPSWFSPPLLLRIFLFPELLVLLKRTVTSPPRSREIRSNFFPPRPVMPSLFFCAPSVSQGYGWNPFFWYCSLFSLRALLPLADRSAPLFLVRGCPFSLCQSPQVFACYAGPLNLGPDLLFAGDFWFLCVFPPSGVWFSTSLVFSRDSGGVAGLASSSHFFLSLLAST